MKHFTTVLTVLLLVLSASAQTYTVSGVLRSHISHQPLSNAYVWLQGVPDSIFAGPTGHYEIFLATGIFFVYFGGASSCDSLVTVAINFSDLVLNLELLEPNFAASVTSINVMSWPGHNAWTQFELSNFSAECPLSFSITDTSDWLSTEPSSGSINPDGVQVITVSMDGNITPDEYQSVLRITYNGANSPYIIPVIFVNWVSADEPSVATPASIVMSSFPNPFNALTRISFSLPVPAEIHLSVHDITGRSMATLTHGQLNVGDHSVAFDGSALSSGIYFAHLSAGNIQRTQKLVLLK